MDRCVGYSFYLLGVCSQNEWEVMTVMTSMHSRPDVEVNKHLGISNNHWRFFFPNLLHYSAMLLYDSYYSCTEGHEPAIFVLFKATLLSFVPSVMAKANGNKYSVMIRFLPIKDEEEEKNSWIALFGRNQIYQIFFLKDFRQFFHELQQIFSNF